MLNRSKTIAVKKELEESADLSEIEDQIEDDKKSWEPSDPSWKSDSEDPDVKKRATCLIMPNNQYKIVWEFIVATLLIITCLTIPVTLALNFDQEESFEWKIFNWGVDIIFGIDIIITFNTAIQVDQCEIIVNKKEIAKLYLEKWFWIDLLVTLPFTDLLSLWSRSMKNLAQFAKFVRILKIIRLIRLVKLLKVAKEKHRMAMLMPNKVKLNYGVYRLCLSVLFFLLICHVMACLWIFQGKQGTPN